MLKIKVYMRGTIEYSRDTIDIPNLNQTKEEFEYNFANSDDCFFGGDVYETCPYFSNYDSDLLEAYVGGDEDLSNDETPVYLCSNLKEFEFIDGGRCDYVPDIPQNKEQANIWWNHDMKFNQLYYWENFNEFDPKKLKIQIGKDQDGREYMEELIYDGEAPDDYIDYGDTGYGYDGPYFIYHPEKIFKENT